MDDAAGLCFVAVIGGRDVAVAIVDAGIVEADPGDHAVAVEPVGEPLAAEIVAARAVAEERATQGRGHDAVYVLDAVVVLLRQSPEAGTPGMV